MAKIILLGAPGAGKGTQAEVLNQKLGIPTISTGNILKAAIREGTPLGLQAKSYIESGALVPDATIIGIIKERLAQDDCKNGYILDGVPRTVAQAQALDDMGIEITNVISIEVPDENIINRLTGRIICSKCGSSYHKVAKKPKVEGVCDLCGGKLVTRSDDEHDTVVKRLATYHELTEPLKGYYEKKGILASIDGTKSVEETSKALLSVIGVL